MDILKINTSPSFQIVPRKQLIASRVYKFQLVNEITKAKQDILASVLVMPNENYAAIMAIFPIGKDGEKLAYTLVDNLTNEIVLLGKLMIVTNTQNVQDYSRKNNNKFYN